MNREFVSKESDFDAMLRKREADGWRYSGREKLTKVKFSDEAKFEDVQFQTEDDIREKYKSSAEHGDRTSKFEVDLVLDENTDKLTRFKKFVTNEEYANIIQNLRPADRNYFVFVRKV